MNTAALSRILAFTSVLTLLAFAGGCGPKWDDCGELGSVGNKCRKTCDGPYDWECVDQGGEAVCGDPAPCDAQDHCEPKECYRTTCSTSRRMDAPGIYTCTDAVCCRAVPLGPNEPCNGGAGKCDGAGNCIPD